MFEQKKVAYSVIGFFFVFLFIVSPLRKDQKINIVSPLPFFLDRGQNKEVTTLSLFLPNEKEILPTKLPKPEISAQSALIYDLTSGKFLYEKNIHEKLETASLVKIMTAIVALENQKSGDKYVVDEFSANIGENSMGVSSGETLSLEELLYGLMLESGNDAAETLASNTIGGREEFIRKMNNKAKSLGLVDSIFSNPSGLEDEKVQYSSAYDLLVMTKFALTYFPLFTKITQTFTINIPATPTHKEFYLQNQTNLLTSYPGVKGVKTGYTPKAGFCLVTYVEDGGHKIIGVILNSSDRRDEMRELLDYSFKNLVGAARLERATSRSQTAHSTN